MNKPADTIRDGKLKATIWRNESDNGTFYSVDFVRGYKDGEEWKDATSFNGSDCLQVANLATRAYNRILELKAQDKQDG